MHLLKLPVIDTLRLSPLAFPCNPYHHLVKHYQDGSLRGRQLNDPKLDSRLTLKVFFEQFHELKKTELGLLTAWHWLTTPDPEGIDRSLSMFFSKLRGTHRPSSAEARMAISEQLVSVACSTHGRKVVAMKQFRWPMAYVLAWLSVSGGNSMMPPVGALPISRSGTTGTFAQRYCM